MRFDENRECGLKPAEGNLTWRETVTAFNAMAACRDFSSVSGVFYLPCLEDCEVAEECDWSKARFFDDRKCRVERKWESEDLERCFNDAEIFTLGDSTLRLYEAQIFAWIYNSTLDKHIFPLGRARDKETSFYWLRNRTHTERLYSQPHMALHETPFSYSLGWPESKREKYQEFLNGTVSKFIKKELPHVLEVFKLTKKRKKLFFIGSCDYFNPELLSIIADFVQLHSDVFESVKIVYRSNQVTALINTSGYTHNPGYSVGDLQRPAAELQDRLSGQLFLPWSYITTEFRQRTRLALDFAKRAGFITVDSWNVSHILPQEFYQRVLQHQMHEVGLENSSNVDVFSIEYPSQLDFASSDKFGDDGSYL